MVYQHTGNQCSKEGIMVDRPIMETIGGRELVLWFVYCSVNDGPNLISTQIRSITNVYICLQLNIHRPPSRRCIWTMKSIFTLFGFISLQRTYDTMIQLVCKMCKHMYY